MLAACLGAGARASEVRCAAGDLRLTFDGLELMDLSWQGRQILENKYYIVAGSDAKTLESFYLGGDMDLPMQRRPGPEGGTMLIWEGDLAESRGCVHLRQEAIVQPGKVTFVYQVKANKDLVPMFRTSRGQSRETFDREAAKYVYPKHFYWLVRGIDPGMFGVPAEGPAAEGEGLRTVRVPERDDEKVTDASLFTGPIGAKQRIVRWHTPEGTIEARFATTQPEHTSLYVYVQEDNHTDEPFWHIGVSDDTFATEDKLPAGYENTFAVTYLFDAAAEPAPEEEPAAEQEPKPEAGAAEQPAEPAEGAPEKPAAAPELAPEEEAPDAPEEKPAETPAAAPEEADNAPEQGAPDEEPAEQAAEEPDRAAPEDGEPEPEAPPEDKPAQEPTEAPEGKPEEEPVQDAQ